jgi:hypothetical protein
MAGGKAEKAQGNLLYTLSTKLPPSMDKYTQTFVDCIMANKWARVMNIDEAIAYVKEKLQSVGDEYTIDLKDFELASGAGIDVTEEDCQKLVDETFADYKSEIEQLGWDFQWTKIIKTIEEKNKWADKKIVMQKINEKQV